MDFSGFRDRSELSAYALPAMQWFASSGVITGKGGILDPQGKCDPRPDRGDALFLLREYRRLIWLGGRFHGVEAAYEQENPAGPSLAPAGFLRSKSL